jgi:hypothetical protein
MEENVVIPAQAGIQNILNFLDSVFRRNDKSGKYNTVYKPVMTKKIVVQVSRYLKAENET